MPDAIEIAKIMAKKPENSYLEILMDSGDERCVHPNSMSSYLDGFQG
jgi:hypothetical protein